MFLTRLWRKEPFKELGFQYGCGEETARRYFDEILALFHKTLVHRLVFLRSPEDVRNMNPSHVQEAFPDLLFILDATNWQQQKPENFVENRLTYSAYKHYNSFQVLFGTCAA